MKCLHLVIVAVGLLVSLSVVTRLRARSLCLALRFGCYVVSMLWVLCSVGMVLLKVLLVTRQSSYVAVCRQCRRVLLGPGNRVLSCLSLVCVLLKCDRWSSRCVWIVCV